MTYLAVCCDAPGPLFVLQDVQPLSRSLPTTWQRHINVTAGMSGNISSHSFLTGVVTVAASKGVPNHPGRSIDKCLFTAVLEFSWSRPHPPAQLAGCCFVLPAHGFSLVVTVRVRGSSRLIRYELLCLLSCWVFVLGVRLGVKGPISPCSCGPSSLQAR